MKGEVIQCPHCESNLLIKLEKDEVTCSVVGAGKKLVSEEPPPDPDPKKKTDPNPDEEKPKSLYEYLGGSNKVKKKDGEE